ncbi:alpha/beta-hydrolase [Ramaria rubella]|nr:alpha/beta-hydrolase [Ramaria rubella]
MSLKFEITNVSIPSKTPNWNLDAWKYLPIDSEDSGRRRAPFPVIILAHGFGADKRGGLDVFASRYAAEGYACIAFDYRRWGASDGTPRHTLRISEQLDDYRTVIDWTQGEPELDHQRVVIWGTSFSGGHILQLASEVATQKLNIVAAMSECPHAGGAIETIGFIAILDLLCLLPYAFFDAFKQFLGFAPVYVPAASEPWQGGIVSYPGSLEGFLSLTGGEPKNAVNEIDASALFRVATYNPQLGASSITCPLLLVIPENDELTSMPNALEAGRKAKRAEVVRTTGGHYDVYPGHVGFEQAVKAQLEFLKKHVPIPVV